MNTFIERTKLYAPLALTKKFGHETNKIIGFIPCPCIIKRINEETQEFEVEFILEQLHDFNMPSKTSFIGSNVVPTVATDINLMNEICNTLTNEVISNTYNRQLFQAMMEVRPSIRNYCATLKRIPKTK